MDQGIGQPVRRKEDETLLTGQGRFSDDFNRAGQAHAVFVRTDLPHGVLKSIDTGPAAAVAGVLAVLTGADYLADGRIGTPPMRTPPGDEPLRRRDGLDTFSVPIVPLVTDKVRRVGEIVCVVVAETLAIARDAAERVTVDLDPLAPLVTPAAALAGGSPLIWEGAPGNLSIDDERGDGAATDAAFAAAAHVARIQVLNQRITGVPMEPRAAVGWVDGDTGVHTLYAGSAATVRHQHGMAHVLGLERSQVRVFCDQVGGAFGTRGQFYNEFPLVMWAAMRTGRPVKWTCERGEAFLSDAGARDQSTEVELALDAAGKFLALRADHIADLGSHPVSFVPLHRGISVTTSIYDIPAIHVTARAVFTNTLPTHTYRGAGRPEAMYLMERLIDTAAAEMGIDPVELRRRNMIPPTAMPFANLNGMVFDSGEFEKSMDMALELADWDGFHGRKSAAASRGLLAGRGLCNYIETATGLPPERCEIYVRAEGRVDLVAGTNDSGQGHATSYAQLITEWLGVPFDHIHLTEGDTDIASMGSGSHSSRSMRTVGLLMGQARDQILDKGRAIAAHLLEAAPADIEFAQGRFTVTGTDRSFGLFEVAAAAENPASDLPDELKGSLEGAAQRTELLPAFPNGCHICEVEVDPEAGAVQITRYAAIDDVGRVINPMIVDGQVHGGVAQGVGQALLEACVHDPDTGQVLSGSFLDYALPRADHLPDIKTGFNEVLAANNPLGVKGAGEGGTTGAPPAVINAIVDALRHLGVTHVEMPATPERVWRAIRNAQEA
jgi:carbon-monoxide dehydrogenase large subunit